MLQSRPHLPAELDYRSDKSTVTPRHFLNSCHRPSLFLLSSGEVHEVPAGADTKLDETGGLASPRSLMVANRKHGDIYLNLIGADSTPSPTNHRRLAGVIFCHGSSVSATRSASGRSCPNICCLRPCMKPLSSPPSPLPSSPLSVKNRAQLRVSPRRFWRL